MYPEIAGKVALVTGASRGFGRSIALRLAAEGATVVVNYRRSRQEAEAVIAEIASRGGEAAAVRADVGDEDAVGGMFESIFRTLPRAHIVISNAAFGTPGSVLGARSKHWDVTMAATAQGLQWLAQNAVPRMGAWGRIVAISSEGGPRVLPGYGVVGVAKGPSNSKP